MKLPRYIRDYILLPGTVLLCGALVFIAVKVFYYASDRGVFTGELQIDAFLLLMIGTPFYLVISFLWNKVEDINVQQHIEQHWPQNSKDTNSES